MKESKPICHTVASLEVLMDERLRSYERLTDERFSHINDIIEAKEQALRLQAKEYERRLEALNGEQERIAKSQVTYVSRELWDHFHVRVENFMATLSAQRQGVGTIGQIVLGIVAILGVSIAFFSLTK